MQKRLLAGAMAIFSNSLSHLQPSTLISIHLEPVELGVYDFEQPVGGSGLDLRQTTQVAIEMSSGRKS